MLFFSIAFAGTFTVLEPGLEFAEFAAPQPSDIGDSIIRVVRVDPATHEIVLRTGALQSARQWADAESLSVVINPGMFHHDGRSTGHMHVGETVVNPAYTSDKHVFVTGPPAILDAGCDDISTSAARPAAVQSIRMLSCDGRNVWSQQPKKWSHAIYGIDGQGRMLFIHARSPWSTHDFIEQVRALPLDAQRLTYGEGGPEASLFVRAGEFEGEYVGSYETGFWENDDNTRSWNLPNVLGVKAK